MKDIIRKINNNIFFIIIKKSFSVIIYTILLLILFYNVTIIVKKKMNPSKTPDFFGYTNYVVMSGSMAPGINIGDIIVVKKVSSGDIHFGDVVSFKENNSIVTHRIVGIVYEDGIKFITKGDYNNVEDKGLLPYDKIEGKVLTVVPNLGKYALLLQNKATVAIIVTFLFIFSFWNFKDNDDEEDEEEVDIDAVSF